VKEVTSDHAVHWSTGDWDLEKGYLPAAAFRGKFGRVPRIVAIDFGIKQNILRMMVSHGFDVTVVRPAPPPRRSWRTLRTASSCRTGRGTPKACRTPFATVRALLGKVPMFGICLGHQIMGLAQGGTTFKLKFGHHGCNQPVKDLATGKVEITSQNHNYSVDPASLDASARITHVNLNDGTVEGSPSRDALLLRAVPPGGVPRPARLPLPLHPLPSIPVRRGGAVSAHAVHAASKSALSACRLCPRSAA